MSEENKEKSEELIEKELHLLEMARMKKMLAQSQLEAAEIGYQNILLQVSAKYNLTEKDSVDEKGKIIRGTIK